MKNFKFIVLAVIALALGSCQDAIDITQPGELSPDVAFQNVEDLQKGLVGLYGAIPGETEVSFSSIFTDEVRIGVGNGGQGLISGEYGFVLTTGSADARSIYSSYSILTNFANRLIEGAAKVTPDATNDEEVAQYKNIIAQAHIIRAWAHFKLLCYFSPDMTDDNALGAVILDHVPLTTEFIPRSKNGDVYTFINADLEYVSDLSSLATDPYQNADNADRRFISADFVKAFRARMALYRGDFATAGALADELVASYPLVAQTAAGRTQYANIWKDTELKAEQIFRLDRVNDDAKIGTAWASVNATVTGSPFYEMSTTLYDLLSQNTGDIRKGAFLSPDYTDEIHPIGKYSGSGGIALLNDLKIFRTAEMIFIKAEQQANDGDLAGVKATLQKINHARFTPANEPQIAVPASTQAAWAEILKQRQIELCYEGHRYLDLKRIGPKAGVDITRNPADCAVNGACSLSSSDYRFTLPIPASELAGNPSIRSQQNPGYPTN